MAYRLDSTPPPKPEDMLPRYFVRNGATLDLAFWCYYYDPKLWHDPHYHDYINWPAPDYHGIACQMIAPRNRNPRWPHPVMRVHKDQVPIDFSEEGYDEAEVVFEDSTAASGVTASADFDSEDNYIVMAHFDTSYASFSDKPKELRFTVFVKRSDARDAVCHGILVVQPGPPYPA